MATRLDALNSSLLGAPSVGIDRVVLAWKGASDNVGVVGYDVYAGTMRLASGVPGTSYTLAGLSCGSAYTLTLRARDLAGNVSAASPALSLRTGACP